MAGSPKETLEIHPEARSEADEETREVYLPGGRTLAVTGELVEIKSGSGLVELRIRLTDQGPILQMESVRLQLKASEAVEIESKRVEIKATEEARIESKGEVAVEGEGDVRVVGKTIHLN